MPDGRSCGREGSCTESCGTGQGVVELVLEEWKEKRERESQGDMEEQAQAESRIRRMVLNHLHIYLSMESFSLYFPEPPGAPAPVQKHLPSQLLGRCTLTCRAVL